MIYKARLCNKKYRSPCAFKNLPVWEKTESDWCVERLARASTLRPFEFENTSWAFVTRAICACASCLVFHPVVLVKSLFRGLLILVQEFTAFSFVGVVFQFSERFLLTSPNTSIDWEKQLAISSIRSFSVTKSLAQVKCIIIRDK